MIDGKVLDLIRQVVILGAGGTALDALDILEAANAGGTKYECLGCLDDEPQRWNQRIGAVRILGPLRLASEFADARFVHAIGSPKNFRHRVAILERLGLRADRFQSLVHPTAVVSPSCKLGDGVLVGAHAFLGGRTRIGDGVTILSHAVVNHDSEIGDWTLVASGANIAGGVRVASVCYLGAGAALKEGIQVGEGALVGMGSVVIMDVPAEAVVAGNPAREIKTASDAK